VPAPCDISSQRIDISSLDQDEESKCSQSRRIEGAINITSNVSQRSNMSNRTSKKKKRSPKGEERKSISVQ